MLPDDSAHAVIHGVARSRQIGPGSADGQHTPAYGDNVVAMPISPGMEDGHVGNRGYLGKAAYHRAHRDSAWIPGCRDDYSH